MNLLQISMEHLDIIIYISQNLIYVYSQFGGLHLEFSNSAHQMRSCFIATPVPGSQKHAQALESCGYTS
jgi:hypothetical protein